VSFIPNMIWLGLILLLQYFILNYLISMFRYVHFLYTIFVMVMIYLRINSKLKLLFIASTSMSKNGQASWGIRQQERNAITAGLPVDGASAA
jgi:hypothetical protein